MADDDIARQSRWWTVWSFGGLVAWIGVTVLVAVVNDDASDPGPVLRTFAIAGAVFFGVTFGAAGVQMRRRKVQVTTSLYRRLATRDVTDDDLRSATKGLAGIGSTYLFFGALTTGLMLLAIGLHDEDLFPILLWTVVGLVVVWAGYSVIALRRALSASDAFVAPLGLRLTETPTYVSAGGGGALVGAQEYSGERHGRRVVIRQHPSSAETIVVGTFTASHLRNAQHMSSLTGEPWTSFRRVTAVRGPDTVTVRRQGNGAGRWLLTDLLLAEALAADG
jgi:hypothetical protein